MGGDFCQGGGGVSLNIVVMWGGVEINFCLMRGGGMTISQSPLQVIIAQSLRADMAGLTGLAQYLNSP